MANEGYPAGSSGSISAAQLLLRLTGAATLAAGALLYGDGDATLATLPAVLSGSVLASTGLLAAPAWQSSIALLGTVASKQAAAAGISLDHNSATGNFTLRLSPAATLAANRRWLFPDRDDTAAGLLAQTFTGAQTFDGSFIAVKFGSDARASTIYAAMNAAAGQSRGLAYLTGGNFRWISLTTNDAELGANAGSNYTLTAYDDAGNFIDSPLIVARALAGNMAFSRDVALTKAAGTTLAVASTTDATSKDAASVVLEGGLAVEKGQYLGTFLVIGTNLTVNGSTVTLADACNLVLNTTTGTKIGTATTQKLAFFNAMPIVQPANTTDLRMAVINLGLLATGGATPLNLNGGVLTAAQAVLTTGTITTSQPAIDATQTWNAGGVTFTGWKLNVTNTASAAASLLLDLQIGGTSFFSIRKDGAHLLPVVVVGGTVTASTPTLDATQTWNAGAVTFTGWKLNVTNTASATASLLLDLQISGGSFFSVRRDGALVKALIVDDSAAAAFTFEVKNGGVQAFGVTPGGTATVTRRSASTTGVSYSMQVGHATTATPAAAFGVGLVFELESTTTESNSAGDMTTEWVDATHASRKARVKISAYDTAARECLRLEASGTAAMIGFLGAAAVVRATMAAASGSATRTTFDTTTVTTAQLAERVKALIDDSRSYGLHG